MSSLGIDSAASGCAASGASSCCCCCCCCCCACDGAAFAADATAEAAAAAAAIEGSCCGLCPWAALLRFCTAAAAAAAAAAGAAAATLPVDAPAAFAAAAALPFPTIPFGCWPLSSATASPAAETAPGKIPSTDVATVLAAGDGAKAASSVANEVVHRAACTSAGKLKLERHHKHFRLEPSGQWTQRHSIRGAPKPDGLTVTRHVRSAQANSVQGSGAVAWEGCTGDAAAAQPLCHSAQHHTGAPLQHQHLTPCGVE